MKQTFDRHMSTLFDQPSQSGVAFAGERRFSKSRGLSASVSFLPLPPLSLFGSRFISRAVKTESPLPWSFFAPKPNGNACYAGYHGTTFQPSSTYCSHFRFHLMTKLPVTQVDSTVLPVSFFDQTPSDSRFCPLESG